MFDLSKTQEEASEPNPDAIQEVLALGIRATRLRKAIEDLEDELTQKKKDLQYLTENLMVEAMSNAGPGGLAEVRLEDGTLIQKKPFIHGRLADAEKALAWLREKGEDGIIKNEISVKLRPGDDAMASEVMKFLSLQGLPATQKETVHHSTLQAFLREVRDNPELNETLPRDAFGIHEGEVVIIK